MMGVLGTIPWATNARGYLRLAPLQEAWTGTETQDGKGRRIGGDFLQRLRVRIAGLGMSGLVRPCRLGAENRSHEGEMEMMMVKGTRRRFCLHSRYIKILLFQEKNPIFGPFLKQFLSSNEVLLSHDQSIFAVHLFSGPNSGSKWVRNF